MQTFAIEKQTFSSLHWIVLLSNCLLSYNGVCSIVLKLSICDVTVSQKSSNGDGKLDFFGTLFTRCLCTKIQFNNKRGDVCLRYEGTKCYQLHNVNLSA